MVGGTAVSCLQELSQGQAPQGTPYPEILQSPSQGSHHPEQAHCRRHKAGLLQPPPLTAHGQGQDSDKQPIKAALTSQVQESDASFKPSIWVKTSHY